MSIKVYYALELVRVTTGYNVSTKKTQLRCWRLAVTGPFDLTQHGIEEALRAEVERVLRESAETALWEAYTVAMATPGEVGVKLAAAWQVFWQRFPILVQQNANAAARSLLEAFSIGIIECVVEEDGLVLSIKAGDSPLSKLYDGLHDWVAQQLGGDARKAADLCVDLFKRTSGLSGIDVSVTLPREVSDALAQAAELAKAVEDLPQRLVDLQEEVGRIGQTLGDGLSTVLAQAGDLDRVVCEQLQKVGGIFDLSTDAAKRRLEELLPGAPRLAWDPTPLGNELQQVGRQLYEDAARKIEEEGKRLAERIEALGREVAEAVKRGAVELVDALKSEADGLHQRMKKMSGELVNIEGVYTAAGLTFSVDLSAAVRTQEQRVTAAVEAFVDVHEKALQQAELIAKGVLDEFGNAIQSVADWVGDRLGVRF